MTEITDTPKKDRRTSLRLYAIAPCSLKVANTEKILTGEVKNIGQHGVFIRLDSGVPQNIVGSNASVIIYDKYRPTLPRISAEGKVVHEDEDGIGFYMQRMDSESRSQLKNMLDDVK